MQGTQAPPEVHRQRPLVERRYSNTRKTLAEKGLEFSSVQLDKTKNKTKTAFISQETTPVLALSYICGAYPTAATVQTRWARSPATTTERHQYTTSVDINNTRYERIQSLIQNHMRHVRSESAREQRIALYKR